MDVGLLLVVPRSDIVYNAGSYCSAGKLDYSRECCEIFIRGFLPYYEQLDGIESKLQNIFGVKFSINIYSRNAKDVAETIQYIMEDAGPIAIGSWVTIKSKSIVYLPIYIIQ